MTLPSTFRTAVFAAVASMLACAGTSDYVYTPNTSNATAAGLPAARTAIPQERPQGRLQQ